MKSLLANQRVVIGIGVAVVIVLIFIAASLRSTTTSPPTTSTAPTAVVTLTAHSFNSVSRAPTIQLTAGVGVDITSKQVRTSIDAIHTLNAFLPYRSSVQLESGEETSITIAPVTDTAENWLLPVYINEIDYEISTDDAHSPTQKALFKQAAKDVYAFIKSKGVDPASIMIQWGDRKKIQDRSLKWLAEP